MSRNAVHLAGSVSGTNWTGLLATDAVANERIAMPEAVGAGRHGRCLLRSIEVTSYDNLDWEFWFWRNNLFQQPASPALERWSGYWRFLAAGAVRIAATGLYYYHIDGLALPILDDDAHNAPALGTFLNVSLINRSVASKTATVAAPSVVGYFAATFGLEATYGD